MKVVHLELKEANDFVAEHHRHHKPATGHRFSIGALKKNKLVGVAICGRPVARKTNYKTTVEVLRLCTTGEKNVCSFLLSAAARAAKSLGYSYIQTFILESEHGVSLRATGWDFLGESQGGSWNVPSRSRKSANPTCKKKKYGRTLAT